MTGIVSVSDTYLSMIWLSFADPDGESIYVVTCGVTGEGNGADYVSHFMESVSFE